MIMCSYCRKIIERDDEILGISHGICAECYAMIKVFMSHGEWDELGKWTEQTKGGQLNKQLERCVGIETKMKSVHLVNRKET